MATMKDVARRAGVSPATVSRVLNGSTTVSIDKRRAVMDWVRKLEYVPNVNAQTLVRKRAYLLGVILPDVSNPFFSEIFEQIETYAFSNGYNVIIGNSGGSGIKVLEYADSFLSRQVDGLLLCPVDIRENRWTDRLQAYCPVVSITQSIEGVDSVLGSMQDGGKIVADHLVNLGHEHMAFLGSEDDPKLEGFATQLASHGISFSKDAILFESPWEKTVPSDAYAITREFFSSPRSAGITALFAFNDYAAIGALHALQDLNLDVPRDVALVGFDNTYLARQMRPPLSSVSQPTQDIGRIAVDLILKRIEGRTEEPPSVISLQPRLVVRQSTAPSLDMRA
jgi:LacI family transcriptional regulator